MNTSAHLSICTLQCPDNMMKRRKELREAIKTNNLLNERYAFTFIFAKTNIYIVLDIILLREIFVNGFIIDK